MFLYKEKSLGYIYYLVYKTMEFYRVLYNEDLNAY